MYAGVDGNPTRIRASRRQRSSRRASASTYSLNDKTVLRGGYGLFWAPTQYPAPGEASIGTRGFTAVTTYFASDGWQPDAGGHADQSVPERHRAAAGQRGGLRTGAGGDIHFVDQIGKPALRAAVLGRSAARAAGQQRGLGRLRRQPLGAPGGRRHGGRDGEHQSDSDRIPVARIGAAADGGESVLRQRGVRRAGADRRRSRAASCCGRIRSSTTSSRTA